MRTNRKKTIHLSLLILLLLLGIGYAALRTTLKINGVVDVDKVTWDVHFENVQITQGSVQANPAPTTDETTTTEMTYTIDFTKPGDFYEFTVDIVNDGTIDAMINLLDNKSYSSNGTTEINLPNYLTSTTTYSDGFLIKQNHLLERQTREKIKVRIEFKKDIQPSDLPSDGDTTIVFKFISKYKQADETAIKVKRAYDTGELVYFDPISTSTCNENTFSLSNINDGTSTCYKWRVLTVGDVVSNKNITIQLDHNIVNGTKWTTSSSTASGPTTALSNLATATSNWTRIPPLNYTYDSTGARYNYGIMICTDGICMKNNTTLIAGSVETPMRARMITGAEVGEIVSTVTGSNPWYTTNSNTDGWFYVSRIDKVIGTNNSGEGNTRLSWLFENSTESSITGATNNPYGTNNDGYWTLSPLSTYSSNAWRIIPNSGEFRDLNVSSYYNESFITGVRPVIEIEKNILN